MSTTYRNVIIFGPTGQVGSMAALEASNQGAKVWLAMRDTSKKIPTLFDVDHQPNFKKVKADMTDIESVKEAIKQSQAKAAYIYFVHGPDYKEVTKALKETGVEHVVFLSSFSITPLMTLREIAPTEVIPFVHAQVEILLEDLQFPSHVALRAGSFASNPVHMQLDKSTNTVSLYRADQFKVDNITPEDMGRLAGRVLVNKPSSKSKEIIYMFGGPLVPMSETWDIIHQVTGKSFKVKDNNREDYINALKAKHIPDPLCEYMAKFLEKPQEEHLPGNVYQEGYDNIEKYTGRKAMTFREYVEAHKDDFN